MPSDDLPGAERPTAADGVHSGPASDSLRSEAPESTPDGRTSRGWNSDDARDWAVKVLSWLPLVLLSAAIAEVVLARPGSRISLTIILAAGICVAVLAWLGLRTLQSWQRRRPADVDPSDRRRSRLGFGGRADRYPLRYYARRAEFVAADLFVAGRRARAERWFAAEESRLLDLLRTEDRRPGAARRLRTVAQALEVWFLRQRRGADLHALADAIAAASERGIARRRWRRAWPEHLPRRHDSEVRNLARITRATALQLKNLPQQAEKELGAITMTYSGSLSGRENNAWAVLRLREVERGRLTGTLPAHSQDNALEEAESCLRDAADRLPFSDLKAWIGIRINLGSLRLRRGEPRQALQHLHEAEWLARQVEDQAARAHALELRGVAEWELGDRVRATRLWREAADLFVELGDEAGLARCLLHSGSALLAQPDLGAQLTDEPGPWTERRAANLAFERLERSLRLRAGDPEDSPGLVLARRYRDQAERLIGPGTARRPPEGEGTPV